jgi:hypothetical protein
MTTSAGKIDGAGWFELKPISGLALCKMRFVVFCGEDAAPFKFRAVCIDLETDAVGNTVGEAFCGLIRDTVHHVNVALEDFNGNREKTMEALTDEMRDRSEDRKAAELAYLEAKARRLKMAILLAKKHREAVWGPKKERRLYLKDDELRKSFLWAALRVLLFRYGTTYKRREAIT